MGVVCSCSDFCNCWWFLSRLFPSEKSKNIKTFYVSHVEKETFKEEILDSDNTRGIFNIQGKVDKVDMEKVDLDLEKARVKVLEEEEGTEVDFNHFRNKSIWPE